MQKYIDYAASIYGIYLRYFSFEDVYVYSIDEAFLDVTGYLARYREMVTSGNRGAILEMPGK